MTSSSPRGTLRRNSVILSPVKPARFFELLNPTVAINTSRSASSDQTPRVHRNRDPCDVGVGIFQMDVKHRHVSPRAHGADLELTQGFEEVLVCSRGLRIRMTASDRSQD